jgi:tetratricopeptide (TPR) repeat protein
MLPSNDPLAELAAAMESRMRCSDEQREKSWREIQRRVRVAANDDGLPAAVVIDAFPETTRWARTVSRAHVSACVLAAGLVIGFIGGAYARPEPPAKVEPEVAEAAQLTRVQGALLIQYLDAQDLICDAVIEESPEVTPSSGRTAELNVGDDERSKAVALAREGRAARRTGDLATARRLLEAALRVNPRDAGALNSLGRVAAEAGNRAEAEALFRRALAIDSNNAYALVNLATLFSDRKDFDRARALVERAVKVDPALDRAHEMASRLKSGGSSTRAEGKRSLKETEHGME